MASEGDELLARNGSQRNTDEVTPKVIWILTVWLLITGKLWAADPDFTGDGQMRFPEHYREWVYLSSGFDMSYTPGSQGNSMHMFDNVFVNPEAYRAFVATGAWPDRTVMVLESRNANSRGSINQSGHYQAKEVMGVEVHVKDSTRFRSSGNWAFYSFDKGKTAKMIPSSAGCYSCHRQHGVVDTTFVQFYPTLNVRAGKPASSGTAK